MARVKAVTEACQVSAAIGVGDGVGKTKYLGVVGIVVLHHTIDEGLFLLTLDIDGANTLQVDGVLMNQMFVSSQLSDKFPNTIFVKKALRLFFLPLITQLNFKPGFKKAGSTEAIGQNFKLEFGGDGKNGRIRFEGDQGFRCLLLPMTFNFWVVWPLANSMKWTCSSRETSTLNQSERALTHLADSVKAPRILVSSLPELTTGVQIGQNQLNGRHLEFGVHTGMPRPLSRMDTDPSTWMDTSILEQKPARCSSMELSRTSKTQ